MWIGGFLLACGLLCGAPAASAQAVIYKDFDSPNLNYYEGDGTENGIRFIQTQPWDPSATPPLGGFLLMPFSPNYTDSTIPTWSLWQNMRWVVDPSIQTATPTPVATWGMGAIPDFTPTPQTITTQNISLENVAWQLKNVTLHSRGGSSTFDLVNSTVNLANHHSTISKLFDGTATINASGTANTIEGIRHQLAGGSVGINVASGSSLTFFGCGSAATTDPDERLWLSEGGNQIDVNGGVLQLQESALLVDQNNTGSFHVRNGGTLELSVSNTRLEIEKGDLNLDLSYATLNPNTQISIDGSLVTNNAAITLVEGAGLISEGFFASGHTQFSLYKTTTTNDEGVRLATIALTDATSSVAASGTGTIRGNFYLQDVNNVGAAMILSGGTFDVEHTDFLIDGIVDPGTGTLSIDSQSVLRIGDASDSTSSFYKRSGLNLVNNGTISVNGKFSGTGTVSSTTAGSEFRIDLGGELFVTGDTGTSLTIQNSVLLNDVSSTHLSLDPSLGLSDHIDVSNGALRIASLAELNLVLENDTLLPVDTKFLLFDYSDAFGVEGEFHGLDDGTTFAVGLNSYRIAYADPQWDAANASVITLTVVPEPSSFALAAAGLAATAAISIRRRALRRRRS